MRKGFPTPIQKLILVYLSGIDDDFRYRAKTINALNWLDKLIDIDVKVIPRCIMESDNISVFRWWERKCGSSGPSLHDINRVNSVNIAKYLHSRYGTDHLYVMKRIEDKEARRGYHRKFEYENRGIARKLKLGNSVSAFGDVEIKTDILGYYCLEGNYEMVKWIFDTKYVHYDGAHHWNNILLFTIYGGHLQIIKLLMEHYNSYIDMMIHYANNGDGKDAFGHNDDYYSMDEFRNGLFYHLCKKGYLGMLTWYTRLFKVDKPEKGFIYACANGQLSIAKFLVRYFEIKPILDHSHDGTYRRIGRSIIYAARNGHLNIIRWMINKFDLTVNDCCNTDELKDRRYEEEETFVHDIFIEAYKNGQKETAKWIMKKFKLLD